MIKKNNLDLLRRFMDVTQSQISACRHIIKVKSMANKGQRLRLSKNQRQILEILEKYKELTARDVAEILWARDIGYKTPEYSSVHRSLTTLTEKG